MQGENIHKAELMRALKTAMGNNVKPDTVNAAANGNLDSLINSLDKDSRDKLNQALSDKNRMQEILNSDAARAIMNSLFGGKHNG